MRNPEYSSIDPNTGNIQWKGPLSIEKGDHSNMPQRTSSYLPGDERGHINASSLSGGNGVDNVAPQHHDLNQGAYKSMERGESTALKNGASIDSTKTAIVNGVPGDRPIGFLVNDNVTYADGHTETISFSFTNVSNAEQQAWNAQAAALPGVYDAPNPGDGLRASMSSEEYSQLMDSTDAELPGIKDYYVPTNYVTADNTISRTSGSDSESANVESFNSFDTVNSVVSDSTITSAECGRDD